VNLALNLSINLGSCRVYHLSIDSSHHWSVDILIMLIAYLCGCLIVVLIV